MVESGSWARTPLLNQAEIIMVWNDGRKSKLGTIDIAVNAETEGKIRVKIRHLRQKIGWELIRQGFWLMFPGRTWEMR